MRSLLLRESSQLVMIILIVIMVAYMCWGTISWVRFVIYANAALLLALVYFYRMPDESKFARSSETLIAPCDGQVMGIDDSKMVIFLSPLDVHVQVAPCDMTLITSYYIPGKYSLAFSKDSIDNERLVTVWKPDDTARFGDTITIHQVAGWLVRRIVCFVGNGGHIKQGEPIGMIKLGSQVRILTSRSKLWTKPYQIGDRINIGKRL